MGISTAPGAKPTKEFFVPATGVMSGGTLAFSGTARAAAVLAGASQMAAISLFVPADYHSIIEAVIIVNPTATQAAANYDLISIYAANGQAENTHTQSDSATTYNVTANQLYEIDVSGLLSSLAAGDYVGLRLTEGTAGHNVDVLGARIRYS